MYRRSFRSSGFLHSDDEPESSSDDEADLEVVVEEDEASGA